MTDAKTRATEDRQQRGVSGAESRQAPNGVAASSGGATPASGTAPAARPAKRRPSTAGYWVGALIALLATLGAIAWGALTFLGWRAQVEDFVRLTPPGTAVVSVADPGTRFIYLEHARSTAAPTAPTVTVTGPSGADVRLTAYRGEMRYDVPNARSQVGDAVLTFRADRSGDYRVNVTNAPPGTTLAIGADLLWSWGPRVVGVVALLLGGLGLALTVVAITAARRSTQEPSS